VKRYLFLVNEAINKRWLVWNELQCLFYSLIAKLVLLPCNKVGVGRGFKFYGLPIIFKHRQSLIKIGRNFENRNLINSNPLTIDHPTVIATTEAGSKIVIGNHVGISGGNIVAAKKISIGDYTMIGSNCLIIDTDFHPLGAAERRYTRTGAKSAPIIIGKNVFIGTRSIILRGIKIGNNSIIGAGSIVRHDIPENSIYVDGKIKRLKSIK
jgi:acetyltransferase-like isoleucine patch superfamily enzyme